MNKFLPVIKLQIFFSRSGNAVTGNLEQQYLAMMPPPVRESILRYKRWQDRQATLFGKLMLLRELCNRFPEEGACMFNALTLSLDGKPFIPGGPQFNISHSEEIVALAVRQNGSVGIDIEKIRPVNIDDFAGYLPEVECLRGRHEADQVSSIFFDCWTRKEAVMKAQGKGLMAPLDQVAVMDNRAFFENTSWVIKKVPIAEGYCCHVAADRQIEDIVIEQVNLMNGVC